VSADYSFIHLLIHRSSSAGLYLYKYCELRCKIAPRQSWHVCLMQHQNSRYFRCPIWKTKSW